MTQRYNFQPYDFTLTPGGSQTILVMGEYFRIQSATGAVTVTVEGYGKLPGLLTGQGLQRVPYSRLILTDASGAANAGVILCSGAEFVDNRTYGVNSLDAPTIAALKLSTPRPEAATGFLNYQGSVAANAPLVMFTPASNPNGVILQSAFMTDFQISIGILACGFIAKNAAPANALDGQVVLAPHLDAAVPATGYWHSGQLNQPVLIPAGLGLYFVSDTATNVSSTRRIAWRAL